MDPKMEKELHEQIRLSEKWGLQRGSPIWIRFFIECDSLRIRDSLLGVLSDCRPFDAQAEYDRTYAPPRFHRNQDHAFVQGQTNPFPFDGDTLREELERIYQVAFDAGAHVPFTWHLGEPTTRDHEP
jgi:hypothetical protein